jgi:hypothetical protein
MSSVFMNKKQLTPLTHAQIVTWAVSLLGGGEKRIDTEDVAVKAFELAPKRFCWRKYPEQINLELVRVCLSNAKKPKNGVLLAGSGRTGWSLTRKGLDWVHSARRRLRQLQLVGVQGGTSRAGSIDSTRKDRERKRILAMPAWKRWSAGDISVVPAEAQEVFRIDSYSTAPVREAKMTRLRSMFEDDRELDPFLSHLSAEIDKEDLNDSNR